MSRCGIVGQVVDERPALDVLAEEERQLELRRPSASRRADQFLEPHRLADARWAPRCRRCSGPAAARRRGRRHLQVQREVVGEGRDLVQPQAGFEGDFVLRDDRPGVDADDLDVEAEVGERLLEQRRDLAELLLVVLDRERLGVAQQRQRRQFVIGVRGRLVRRRPDGTASPASARARCERGSGCRRGSPAPSRASSG